MTECDIATLFGNARVVCEVDLPEHSRKAFDTKQKKNAITERAVSCHDVRGKEVQQCYSCVHSSVQCPSVCHCIILIHCSEAKHVDLIPARI